MSMENFTGKQVKLNHQALIQENLDFINEMASMEETPYENLDYKGNYIDSLVREYKPLSQEERLNRAKKYWQWWLLADYNSSCPIVNTDDEVYECLLDANNKDDRFPQRVKEINYEEPTNWCKLRNPLAQHPSVEFFYIDKKYLVLVKE